MAASMNTAVIGDCRFVWSCRSLPTFQRPLLPPTSTRLQCATTQKTDIRVA
jgi:hypothetical protein